MVGRAGRAGMTESGDSVLLCQENDKKKVIIMNFEILFNIKCIQILYDHF